MPSSLKSSDLIPLSAAPAELEPYARRAGRPTTKYRSIYGRVLDRELPALQIGKFWYLERKNLPLIAELLGLVPAAPVKARKGAAIVPVGPIP